MAGPGERKARPTRFFHSVFGLIVCSDIFFPEILVGQPAQPDLTISNRFLAPLRAKSIRVRDHRLQLCRGGARLSWPEEVAIEIRSGRDILFDACSGLDQNVLRLVLLGPALSVLIEQRGLLPLHASAVRMKDRAVAFVGESGAGKSTLAAALLRRGHALITDNTLAVDDSTPSRVFPGPAQMKLCADAAAHTGHDFGRLSPIEPGSPKRYAVAEPVPQLALELGTVYLLNRTHCTRSPISAVGAREALIRLYASSTGTAPWAGFEQRRRLFRQCERLVRTVRVRRLDICGRLDHLKGLLDAIERD